MRLKVKCNDKSGLLAAAEQLQWSRWRLIAAHRDTSTLVVEGGESITQYLSSPVWGFKLATVQSCFSNLYTAAISTWDDFPNKTPYMPK